MSAKNGKDLDLETIVLVDLDVGLPLGVSRGAAADLGLQEDDAPKAVFKIAKRYLPRAWLSEHLSIVGRAQRVLDENASPVQFPLGKARAVPLASIATVLDGLAACKADFIEATDMKVESRAYTTMREQALKAHPKFRETLEQCFPPPADMRRRFRFEWTLFEVALPKRARFKAAKGQKLLAAQQMLAEEGEKARAQIAGFFAQHNARILAEVQTVCARVADRVAKGEIVNESTLTGISKKLQWFERMSSLYGDSPVPVQVSKLLADLKRRASTTLASDVRTNPATAAEFGAALTKAAAACTSAADVVLRPGSYGRKLR